MKIADVERIMSEYVGWHWGRTRGLDFWLQEVLGDFNDLVQGEDASDTDPRAFCPVCVGSGRLDSMEQVNIDGVNAELLEERNGMAAEIVTLRVKVKKLQDKTNAQAARIRKLAKIELANQELRKK